MSAETDLVRARGATNEADAFISGCAFSRDGTQAAFATSEGCLHLFDCNGREWSRCDVHDGAILSLACDVSERGFLTGGDDNRLCRVVDAKSAVEELARGRRWIEHVTTARDGKTGLIAHASGKELELRDASGKLRQSWSHASTITGIAFDAKAKRLAASHYGGVSLRYVNAKSDQPRLLAWKGSHIGVAIHPLGEAVVSAMQENELHGWRLEDSHNMRMSGYPQKTLSLSFTRNGRWLATSGADVIVLWPFFGGGPMGKAPSELASVPGVICKVVACHPQHEMVAAGFADGSVLIADIGTKRVLPIQAAGGSAISTLAFSADGKQLAFGIESGTMTFINLAASQELS